jgi:hypothetical protein
VLDSGQLVRRPELTPANAPIAIEDQGSMRGSLLDLALFQRTPV